MCTLSRPGAITVDPHREFPALPEEVLLQILHPFADSIQHYAEEIAVYHRPALADDACKLTTPSSISVRQVSDPGRQKLHLHPGWQDNRWNAISRRSGGPRFNRWNRIDGFPSHIP